MPVTGYVTLSKSLTSTDSVPTVVKMERTLSTLPASQCHSEHLMTSHL